jgi:toxin ParE1/3/4
MNEFKVSYSKQAEKDLDDIYSYIAIEKKDVINATRLIRRLSKSINDLSFMADSYHFYQEEPYLGQEVRYFSEGNYCIFYIIIDKTAYVIRIIYGARDLRTVLA